MKLRETTVDSESQRLAQRVAKLEEKLFGAMERIAQLVEENARLHEDVARLQQQLAAARKTPRLLPSRRSFYPCFSAISVALRSLSVTR